MKTFFVQPMNLDHLTTKSIEIQREELRANIVSFVFGHAQICLTSICD